MKSTVNDYFYASFKTKYVALYYRERVSIARKNFVIAWSV